MTLDAGEFMRRFLLHVLPGGFHRIRHYGLLANPVRRANLVRARELLDAASSVTAPPDDTDLAAPTPFLWRHCGAPMLIIEIIPRSVCIRGPPPQRVLA